MKRNSNRNGKKVITILGIVALLWCTVIGIYGIFSAPDSDQAELEQQLMRNEKALEQLEEMNSMPPAEAVTPSAPNIVSPSAVTDADSPLNTPVTPEDAGKPEHTLSVIGDSVFLGASPAFKELMEDAVIDAKISRQVYQAIDVAKKLEKKKKLGDTVIISLGTNGNFNPATGQELIDYLGPDRTIYWINAYGKKLDIQKQVNETIRDLAKKNANVTVISWANEGKEHPDWFYQDGVHLNAKGQTGFARFIQKSIGSADTEH